ncbi:hypothetical protein HS1genome_2115 [Sulfodiicoccus acidiphilus]|uniref:DUF2877 domain-containing protein n=2 Tax=Sulfodiicoccus acidiphilus TaxID=1670455 RepID=A0A348B6C4_9CREN|nr:DUF2877 domain-containing protein [Sulfodiicoccus acidiphilus]BBD73726.1 hypothetical protein HS1genome_2115 [Sulfodiicoccus acidiphilus]GGT97901.1 hypothetical protein GCM10007116_14320 [Sulfodiicoccus acidiphilus]
MESLEASAVGEDLLNELRRRGSVSLEIAVETQDNVYALFRGHLAPASDQPLITPYSVALSPSSKKVGVRASFEGNYLVLTMEGEARAYRRPGESSSDVVNLGEAVKIASVLGSTLSGELDLHVVKLLKHLIISKDDEPGRTLELAQRYVGAGGGSTPSFDDFLAGYLTGWGSSLQAYLDLSNTTQLSRSILSEVITDRDYLIEVAALRECLKGRGDLYSSSLRVASMGGSSGTFMLLGVLSAALQKSGRKDLMTALWNSLS